MRYYLVPIHRRWEADTLPEFMPVILIVAVGAIALVFAYLSMRARRERSKALAAFAYGRGWNFQAGPIEGGGGLFSGSGRSEEHPFGQFEFFQQGHGREFANLMGGVLPGEGLRGTCEAGDFKWVTGSGKNARTHRRSYLLFDVSQELGPLPDLVIRPEGWGDRLWGMVGGGDINFESEEFSRRFHITSSDRKFAFAVIDPRMMAFLMSSPEQTLLMRAGWGLVVSGDGEWDPRDVEWVAGWVREFLGNWPEYLVKQCRERTW